jgi:hypothetical protein
MNTAHEMQSPTLAAAIPAVAASTPAVVTSAYISFVNDLNPWIKIGTLTLIVVQIAYYVIKAVMAVKGKSGD